MPLDLECVWDRGSFAPESLVGYIAPWLLALLLCFCVLLVAPYEAGRAKFEAGLWDEAVMLYQEGISKATWPPFDEAAERQHAESCLLCDAPAIHHRPRLAARAAVGARRPRDDR